MTATEPTTRSIERATAEDLPKLGHLAEEFYAASRFLTSFDLPLFVEFWTAILASGSGVIFLLKDGAEIAGVLGGMAHREPYADRRLAHEFFFFIRAASRGGLGALRLYRAFERWALEEQGCSSIQMVHLQDSMPEKLKRFYLRLGFEAAETVYAKKLK